MKKLLIISNLFWLSIFVFTAFQSSDQTPVKKADKDSAGLVSKPKTKSIDIKAVEEVDCKTICSNYTGVSFTKTEGRISGAFAKQISTLYKMNHYPLASSIVPPKDSRSVWFSLETLKSFLWEIESRTATCKGGCPTLNLGVRIYFAEYPKTVNPNDPLLFDAQFVKNHTIFMVPTYAKAIPGLTLTYENYDFDPTRLTFKDKFGTTFGTTCEPATLADILKNNLTADNLILMPASKSIVRNGTAGSANANQNVSNFSTTSGTYSSVQNHGTLCPPINCPGMAF